MNEKDNPNMNKTDLAFITNEGQQNLKARFRVLMKDTKFFDCLVGYFYTSGFHAVYKSLENTEKIRILKEQVKSKLDNILGIFISPHGFTCDGVIAVQRTRPNVILMDGGDRNTVLEARLDLRELLRRKIRYAAQTGNIFLQAKDMSAV